MCPECECVQSGWVGVGVGVCVCAHAHTRLQVRLRGSLRGKPVELKGGGALGA